MQDLRFAFRQLASSPGLTLIAVLTLALGIGACTAIFSVINALVLRPLPFPDADEIVLVWNRTLAGRNIWATGPMYQAWRDDNSMFDSMAAMLPRDYTLTGGGRTPERIKGINVSASYLHVLRVHPLLGRDFAPDADMAGGANNVVLLTHSMWVTRFGRDAGIIDRTIELDGVSHTVVGVLPPGALPRDDTLFLVPVVIDANPWMQSPRIPWALVTARLKPGVSVAEAEAELSAIGQAHPEALPEGRQRDAAVVPLREQLTGNARPGLYLLGGTGALLLAIACANVANLLLARASARAKEMAVRSALGANARSIIRLVLTENVLLALIGGGVGVLFALFSVDLLGAATRAVDPSYGGVAAGPSLNLRLTGGELPGMLQPRVDWYVLAFASTLAIVTGAVCGLFPALRACRSDVSRGLKDAGRGSTTGGRTRVQSGLVALEVGLTAVLLIMAGLFLRSFAKVVAVDPGFNPRAAVTFGLALTPQMYAETGYVARFTETVTRRIAEQPGITAVGATTNVPFGPESWGSPIGRAEEADRSLDVVTITDFVEGDYFGSMGIPLRRGRFFTPQDNNPSAPPVAIINETLARTLFGEQDPLGRQVITAGVGNGIIWEIVGVVGDLRIRSLEGAAPNCFFGPHAFNPGSAFVVVRSELPFPALREMLTKTVRAIDPDQPVPLRPLSAGLEQSVRGRQSMLTLIDVFAIVALALACLGVYGVMAYTIGQRQRELGIRMALGASQPNVVRLVLRDGLRLALLGLGLGLVAAAGGAQAVSSLLFGVSAHDPVVFGSVTVLLIVLAAIACWLPARRAASADPLTALRAE